MIRDTVLWGEWEAENIRNTKPDFWRNLHLLEAMYEEARELGVFPLSNPLEGLNLKIHLAKVVNVSTGSGKDRIGS